MENLTMTNNQYQEFLKVNANKVWTDKNYTIKDYEREAESVLILPFEVAAGKELATIINKYCNSEKISKEKTTFKGRSSINLYSIMNSLKFNIIGDTGYQAAYYNDKEKATFEYCEGDIYFVVYSDIESYETGKEKLVKFCKENY